jgi:hypothetical protein
MLKNYIELVYVVTLSLLLTIVSFIYDPDVDKIKHAVSLIVLRLIHFLVIVFYIFYLLIFDVNHPLGLVYLFGAIFILAQWLLLRCCIISFLEIYCYKNAMKERVTHNPTLVAILPHYKDIIMKIARVVVVATSVYILLFNTVIPLWVKLLWLAIFVPTAAIFLKTKKTYNTVRYNDVHEHFFGGNECCKN